MTKIILILILSSLLFLVQGACSRLRETTLRNDGDRIILKIEDFRKQNGKLPNSIRDIGVEEKEEGPIYYKKLDATHYQVWFGTQLGESVTYDSQKQSWN